MQDAVAACCLRGVERPICPVDGAREGFVAQVVAHPGREGHAQRRVGLGHLGLCQRGLDAQQHFLGGAFFGVGEHHEELFTAPARDDIGFAQAGGDGAGHLRQHLVASPVPQPVVDALEVIDVDHRQAESAARTHGAVFLGVHELQHAAPVDEAREFVMRGQFADAHERIRQLVLTQVGLAAQLVHLVDQQAHGGQGQQQDAGINQLEGGRVGVFSGVPGHPGHGHAEGQRCKHAGTEQLPGCVGEHAEQQDHHQQQQGQWPPRAADQVTPGQKEDDGRALPFGQGRVAEALVQAGTHERVENAHRHQGGQRQPVAGLRVDQAERRAHVEGQHTGRAVGHAHQEAPANVLLIRVGGQHQVGQPVQAHPARQPAQAQVHQPGRGDGGGGQRQRDQGQQQGGLQGGGEGVRGHRA